MSTTPSVTPAVRPKASAGILRWLKSLVTMVVWVGLVFFGAGTMHWRRGWVCTGIFFCLILAMGYLVERYAPGLLEARSNWRKVESQPYDRVFVILQIVLFLVEVFVAGLDKVRFLWLPLSGSTFLPGLALVLAGMALILWVLLSNPFAESVVRIQAERGQTVITNGPYRFVRHPMYTGSIFMYCALGLMFGSGMALVVAAIIAIVIVWRTAREDRYLRTNLAGYEEFTTETRYRLFPGIW